MAIDSLLRQADQQTRALLHQAEKQFGMRCPLSNIHFDLKGKAAGMVVFKPGRKPYIRFNPAILMRNRDKFLSQTLPHEVAHLVARRLHGAKIRPHGQEWQAVMRFFGADPVRCHNYAMDGVQPRKMRLFAYRCGCRQHQLSAIRHNRILKGQTYLCRHCGKSLNPDFA
ncbi:MAG: SprT-like domain-containing protein [Pseudomonadota bacterium]